MRFRMLVDRNIDVTLIGDTLICDDPVVFSTAEGPFAHYSWFNAETSPEITMDETADVHVMVSDDQGCLVIPTPFMW